MSTPKESLMTVDIPPNPIFVRGVRLGIARIAASFGFDENEVYQIETIVDELGCNASEHGSRGLAGRVRIVCRFAPGSVSLTVIDGGKKKFDPKKVLWRNASRMSREMREGRVLQPGRGGRGLVIVSRFADGLTIRSGRNGTVVRVVKKAEGLP